MFNSYTVTHALDHNAYSYCQVQKLGEQISEQGKTLRKSRSKEKQEQMEARSVHGNENYD